MQPETIREILSTFLDELEELEHPMDKIAAIAALRSDVDDIGDGLRAALRSAIIAARSTDPRPTWSELGSLLGVSAQRAEALSK